MSSDKPADKSDIITRFIFSQDQYNSNGVKHGAFKPPKDYPNEISVCVVTGLSEEEIWNLFPIRGDKPVVARADMKVSEITQISD